ncbi:MAG: 2-oxo acid dehydrogenase subunit E2, partial [Candidatus Heimdallarchaeota archaeon]
PRVIGLIEIDITKALAKIEEIKKKQNYMVSMTGWVAKCVAQAVMENKHLNSYRRGRKIIVFDNVDISVIIELTLKSGKKVPYNYVIRKVETKSVKGITDEIRDAQTKKIDEQEQLTRGQSAYMGFYTLLPRFFRKWVIRKVGITSLGMFIKGQGAWAVPLSDKTLNLALGGIKDNVILRDGKIEERKLLCVTFLIDHDIVDGAPATRFVKSLSILLGDTLYLDDLEKV